MKSKRDRSGVEAESNSVDSEIEVTSKWDRGETEVKSNCFESELEVKSE